MDKSIETSRRRTPQSMRHPLHEISLLRVYQKPIAPLLGLRWQWVVGTRDLARFCLAKVVSTVVGGLEFVALHKHLVHAEDVSCVLSCAWLPSLRVSPDHFASCSIASALLSDNPLTLFPTLGACLFVIDAGVGGLTNERE